MANVVSKQGLKPRQVWTPEYIDSLWKNIHGNKTPLSIKLKQDTIYKFLKGCTSILDVGCGWMHYKTDKNNVGIDLTPSMLKIAKILHPETSLLCGNAFKLPFKNNYFDGVRSTGLLRHIKQWKPVLNEMIRVANYKLAFSHLVGKLPFSHRATGQYQWCTPKKQILKSLPTRKVKLIHIKKWRFFDSILFLAELNG